MIWEACKAKGRWVWRHRTKTLGGIGVAVGTLENQLNSHADLHLPGRGMLLAAFGVLTILLGAYNTLAQYFGWTDPPS